MDIRRCHASSPSYFMCQRAFTNVSSNAKYSPRKLHTTVTFVLLPLTLHSPFGLSFPLLVSALFCDRCKQFSLSTNKEKWKNIIYKNTPKCLYIYSYYLSFYFSYFIDFSLSIYLICICLGVCIFVYMCMILIPLTG